MTTRETTPRGRYEWLRFVLASVLPASTKNVYAFLWSRCGTKLETFWSYPAIATAVGISDREAKSAIGRLLRFGALTIIGRHPEGDVRYRPNIYRLGALGVNTGSRLRGEPTDTPQRRSRGERIDHPGVNVGSPNYKKHRKKQQQQAAPARPAARAAAGYAKKERPEPAKPESEVEACRAVLIRAGIGEPERSRLANHPDATVGILTNAVAGEAGPGLKVQRVREALAAVEASRETEATHRARRARERRERAGDVCRDFRDVYFYPTVAKLHLEAMDEGERNRIWEAYLREANSTKQTLRRMGWQRLAGDVLERVDPGRLRAIRDRALAEVAA